MNVQAILLSALPTDINQGHHVNKMKAKSNKPTSDSDLFESILLEYMTK